VTIRAGGPFDAVVTMTVVEDGRGHTRVAASWTEDGQSWSESLESASYRIARAIAQAAANQLSLGKQPQLARHERASHSSHSARGSPRHPVD